MKRWPVNATALSEAQQHTTLTVQRMISTMINVGEGELEAMLGEGKVFEQGNYELKQIGDDRGEQNSSSVDFTPQPLQRVLWTTVKVSTPLTHAKILKLMDKA
jgi:hypothetical protein